MYDTCTPGTASFGQDLRKQQAYSESFIPVRSVHARCPSACPIVQFERERGGGRDCVGTHLVTIERHEAGMDKVYHGI